MWVLMTLYTIFIVQMFLGVVVGHFEHEWKRMQTINSDKSQSYNLLAVIARILITYFTTRKKEMEEQ